MLTNNQYVVIHTVLTICYLIGLFCLTYALLNQTPMGHFVEKIGVAIFLIGVLGSIASVLIIKKKQSKIK